MAKKFKNFTFSMKRWNESRMDTPDVWQKMSMGAVIHWHQAKNGTMLYRLGDEKINQCSVLSLLDAGRLKRIAVSDTEGYFALKEKEVKKDAT